MFNLQVVAEVIELYGQALPAAFLMAVTFAVFGIFVVLKRIVFIGITLSEVAACGVAAALLLNVPPFLGAATLCLVVVALLAYPYESSRLPRDTVLGSIFIFASGMSILLVARSGFGLEKVKAILYGNLLFASNADLGIITAVMIPALLAVVLFYRPMLYAFLDRESAYTLGIKVWRFELLFFVFLGLIVASSSKIAGVMLVFCYLVIPAATALLLTRSMGKVTLLAVALAIISTWLGIATSYNADLPPNQLIAVISCALLLIAVVFHFAKPVIGKVFASLVAFAGLLILLALLNSLTIEISNVIEPVRVADTPAKQTMKAEGWPQKISQLSDLLKHNKKAGAELAILLLEQNPPPFFLEEIKALTNESININMKFEKQKDIDE